MESLESSSNEHYHDIRSISPTLRLIFHRCVAFDSNLASSVLGYRISEAELPYAAPEMLNILSRAMCKDGGRRESCVHIFYVAILFMHLLLEYIIESYISVIFTVDCAFSSNSLYAEALKLSFWADLGDLFKDASINHVQLTTKCFFRRPSKERKRFRFVRTWPSKIART